METSEFIYQQARNAVIRAGYYTFQAEKSAEHAVNMWRQNRLAKSTYFIDEAIKYAKMHYKKPR